MRHALPAAVVLVALSVLPLGSGLAQTPTDPVVTEGERLFQENCSSCHGAEGAGTDLGPSLQGVGAASADFQLRTGRMPLSHPGQPTLRKPPAFSDEEIDALVAYVASLGEGPAIPEVDTDLGSASAGATLFFDNCAPCHGATANGGAVGGNAFAPSLHPSKPLDIAEAPIVGPGQMPRFSFTDDELNSIVAYVETLKKESGHGGLDIGGVGPVPEGFVAWGVAMVLLVIIVWLIGRPKRGSDEA
jgi:ubiquinol-cytochrome c reductase cytochrome c subunit